MISEKKLKKIKRDWRPIVILIFCTFLIFGFFITTMTEQMSGAEFHKAVAENDNELAVNFPNLPDSCSEFELDTLSFLQSFCVVAIEDDGRLEVAYDVYGLDPLVSQTVLEVTRLEKRDVTVLETITVDAPGQFSTTLEGLKAGEVIGLAFRESYPREGQVDLSKIITVLKLVNK